MAEISAAMVKELRDRTGAGMMDAKKALVEAGGDVDTAIKQLREKGALKAEKKASRETSEGLVSGEVSGGNAILACVLCETDFVAKNQQFKDFVAALSKALVQADSIENTESIPFQEGKTIADALKEQIGVIGENIKIGDTTRLQTESGFFGLYIHNNGKIGVLTQFSGEETEKAKEVAKQIAMHVAFTRPMALTREGVPASKIEEEREVYKNQALSEGKPENIVEKIAEGKINSFFKEHVLLEQEFIMDSKRRIKDVVDELGGGIELQNFAFLAL